MSKSTTPNNGDSDDLDLPAEPAEVIDDHRDVFETIATEADDDEIADLFGRQPLDYLREHGEEGDGDA